ncbi:MAG TPA: hypothetical protein VJV04_06530, partial [Nitrospiraceae bacterium]|nr:hypothetical protein [Nitrospiraceae bacterium]
MGQPRKLDVVDCLGALFIALTSGLLFFVGSGSLDVVAYQWPALDVWFQGDLPRNLQDMTTRWAGHGRTSVHPLFPLITYPLTALAKKAFGV